MIFRKNSSHAKSIKYEFENEIGSQYHKIPKLIFNRFFIEDIILKLNCGMPHKVSKNITFYFFAIVLWEKRRNWNTEYNCYVHVFTSNFKGNNKIINCYEAKQNADVWYLQVKSFYKVFELSEYGTSYYCNNMRVPYLYWTKTNLANITVANASMTKKLLIMIIIVLEKKSIFIWDCTALYLLCGNIE